MWEIDFCKQQFNQRYTNLFYILKLLSFLVQFDGHVFPAFTSMYVFWVHMGYELYSWYTPALIFSFCWFCLSILFRTMTLSLFRLRFSKLFSNCSLYRNSIKWPDWFTDLLNLRSTFSIGSSSLTVIFTVFKENPNSLWERVNYLTREKIEVFHDEEK